MKKSIAFLATLALSGAALVGTSAVATAAPSATAGVEGGDPDWADKLPAEGTHVGLPEGMYRYTPEGEFLPVDLEAVELDAQPPEPASEGGMQPKLIDFSQWAGCFVGNNSSLVFDNYFWMMQEPMQNITLRCGTGDADSGWGYKHIRAGHEADWQRQLDYLRTVSPGFFADKSWDFVMTVSNDSAIYDPLYWKQKGSNTRCALGGNYWLDTNGNTSAPIIGVTAWNTDMNGNGVISSYPTSQQRC